MVGTLRRLAQSLVGASNTTSTSVPSVASRSINERSARSTSWITLITVPTRRRPGHPMRDRLQGTAHCPIGHFPRTALGGRTGTQPRIRVAFPANRVVSAPGIRAPSPVARRRHRPNEQLRGRSMTDPIIQLETTQLTVEPGGQGRTLVTVRNLGNIVEGFALQVLGEGVAEWSEVTPAEVQVYPEQEATAVVVFSPPAGNTTRSGTFPFAVRAESVVDPDASAVAEGDLEIGRVFGLQTRITPVTSSGRWRGKHFIEITNWGNAPVQLKLSAADPDQQLAFLFGPEIMDLPLGVTGHAQLRVRTLKPFLRGAQVRLPFQAVAEPDPPEVPTGPPSMIPNPRRATFDAAFVQRPILSKWVVILGALLLLGIVALVVWLLTRPAEVADGLVQGKPTTPKLSAVSKD